jgi:DNA-binding response OmpR family regulator
LRGLQQVFHSSRAQPILLVDPQLDLGRGLWHQLIRHGLRADLAITVDAARSCVGYKHYYAMIIIADLSNLRELRGWRQLREAAPRTWMIVVASKAADPASRVAANFGSDVCLPTPFRFSDLLSSLALFSHRRRISGLQASADNRPEK